MDCSCDNSASAPAKQSPMAHILSTSFDKAWPAGMAFPPLAPWIGASLSRTQAAAVFARSSSTSTQGQEARTGDEYQGVTQWDQALCDNPIMYALLNVLMYYAALDYCEDHDCELSEVFINPDTCTLETLLCNNCPPTGGGPGGGRPGFNPWLRNLIDQFLEDQNDYWRNHEGSDNSPEAGW